MTRTMSLTAASRWIGIGRRELRDAIDRGDLKAARMTDSPKSKWRVSEQELATWWRSRGGGELTAGGETT